MHHEIGVYERAYDDLVNRPTQSKLEHFNKTVETLDRTVKYAGENNCDILVPKFYTDWVNAK